MSNEKATIPLRASTKDDFDKSICSKMFEIYGKVSYDTIISKLSEYAGEIMRIIRNKEGGIKIEQPQ